MSIDEPVGEWRRSPVLAASGLPYAEPRNGWHEEQCTGELPSCLAHPVAAADDGRSARAPLP